MKVILQTLTVLLVFSLSKCKCNHENDAKLYKSWSEGSEVGQKALDNVATLNAGDDLCVQFRQKFMEVKKNREVSSTFDNNKVTFKVSLKVNKDHKQIEVKALSCDILTTKHKNKRNESKKTKKVFVTAVDDKTFCRLTEKTKNSDKANRLAKLNQCYTIELKKKNQ